MSGRHRIITFFKKAGVRIAISRETISRCCDVAFPTLDLILEELERDGVLERTSIPEMQQWRPCRGFVYDMPPSSEEKAAARKKRIEVADAAKNAKKSIRLWKREERQALRRKKADDVLAKSLERELRIAEAREAKTAYASEAQLRARERRDAKLAASDAAQASRDEKMIKWLAEQREKRRLKAEKAEATKAKWTEVSRAKAAEKEAKKEAARLRIATSKITLPANSPTHIPQTELTVAPPASASDPWAKIRERTYGKPPLMASNLRQLTPEELMIGRRRRA